MPVFISLLRGVNVGGHNKIKMDTLRSLYESLGFSNPQTYIQSGNIVFVTKERNTGLLTKKIQDAIEKTFDFRPAIILRSANELRSAIAASPFAKRKEIEPSKLLVTFLAAVPAPEALVAALKIKTDPEELRIVGSEAFIYFPNGMARPKMSWPAIERALKTTGTGRNWNTVIKLLEIAESLE
jgi:uncharacterized protein (DUF1697 family)